VSVADIYNPDIAPLSYVRVLDYAAQQDFDGRWWYVLVPER
jgi:hypothetical protein